MAGAGSEGAAGFAVIVGKIKRADIGYYSVANDEIESRFGLQYPNGKRVNRLRPLAFAVLACQLRNKMSAPNMFSALISLWPVYYSMTSPDGLARHPTA